MPKVSVIIPVYNTEKYLRKCLDSVCNQTLSDIEIICVNDCSPDNSLDILKEFSQKDSRIKVINFEENKGVSIARNTGIDSATGEFIGFVDADDFIDLDFYEKLYNKAIETDADCVKGNIFDYDEKTDKSTLTAFYDQNDKIRKNKAYFCYGFTSAIYKTKVIQENGVNFPENITYFEDPYFSIFASIYTHNIEFVDSAKYNYIRHEDSACYNSMNEEKVKDFFKIVGIIFEKLQNIELPKEAHSIYISFLLEHLVPKCSDIAIPKLGNEMAIDLCSRIIDENKNILNSVLTEYFMNKKNTEEKNIQKQKANLLKNLRKNIKPRGAL